MLWMLEMGTHFGSWNQWSQVELVCRCRGRSSGTYRSINVRRYSWWWYLFQVCESIVFLTFILPTCVYITIELYILWSLQCQATLVSSGWILLSIAFHCICFHPSWYCCSYLNLNITFFLKFYVFLCCSHLHHGVFATYGWKHYLFTFCMADAVIPSCLVTSITFIYVFVRAGNLVDQSMTADLAGEVTSAAGPVRLEDLQRILSAIQPSSGTSWKPVPTLRVGSVLYAYLKLLLIYIFSCYIRCCSWPWCW